MDPLYSDLIKGLVRYALFGFGVSIVERGIVTQAQWDRLVVGAGAMAVALVWMIINKRHVWFKKIVALALPQGATEAQLEEAVKDKEIRAHVTVPASKHEAPEISNEGLAKVLK